MALHRVPAEELSPAYRARVQSALSNTGDARFLQVLANAPHMAAFYFDQFYDQVFFGGLVPIRVKELVRLRLSKLHGCAY